MSKIWIAADVETTAPVCVRRIPVVQGAHTELNFYNCWETRASWNLGMVFWVDTLQNFRIIVLSVCLCAGMKQILPRAQSIVTLLAVEGRLLSCGVNSLVSCGNSQKW